MKELFDLLLRPRINATVLEILNRRLDDEQVALLLLTEANPYVILTQQEEAKLRGVSPKTLRGMKERGEISKGVNPQFSPKFPIRAPMLPNSARPGGSSPKVV